MADSKESNPDKSFPPNCTNYWVNLSSLTLFFASLYLLRINFPQVATVWIAMTCLLITAIPLWLYDFIILRVHTRPTTGLGMPQDKHNTKRLATKLIGLFGTYIIILFLYHMIPVYRNSFFTPFFDSLKLLGPWIIILNVIYFWAIDPRQKKPQDEYWHIGCALTGQWKKVNAVIVKEHARVWFIKAFFTPIMIGILVQNSDEMFLFQPQNGSWSFLSLHKFLFITIYTIDVIYGILGYILTFRLLDAHIRSTEPTLVGWIVCLACYAPFSDLFGINRFSYDDGLLWYHWFAFSPPSYYFLGVTILLLSLFYSLATVAFGYRMSNLTFRGIITAGPYRYTKHPAYLCKVLSWWLISVPFFSIEGPWTITKNCFNLSIITIIYCLRAWTEENHLSNYTEYVRYANWINRHGIFKSITKRFPALQYSEEKSKRWKSVVWFKK